MRFGHGQWWHVDVIKNVIRAYAEPRTYIEIGIAKAQCWNEIAQEVQEAHGVDSGDVSKYMQLGTFYQMPSDEFFEIYEGSLPDVIFIDGDHTYAGVKRDYYNSLELIHPKGTIILHDTYPHDHPSSWGSEDVYKLLPEIENDPSLRCYTYRCFPGLTLVQKAI